MSETSDLEYFTNRAMGIACEQDFSKRREAFMFLLIEYRGKIRDEITDEGHDRANEETFQKLRLVEGQ